MNRAWWVFAMLVLLLPLYSAPPATAGDTAAEEQQGVGTAAGASYTLEQVFRKVLSDNETIGRAWAEVAKAEAVHSGAWSQVIPSLTFSGSMTRYDKAQELDFGEDEEGNPTSFEIIPENDWAYMFNLRQVLYAGGRPRRALKYTDNLRDLSQQGLEQVRQQVMLAVAAGFTEILKAKNDIRLANTDMELATRQRQVAQSLFDAGEAVRVSVLRAQLAMVSAERKLIKAENRLERGRASFTALTAIGGDFTLIKPPTPSPDLSDQEELITQALATRPEIRAVDLEIRNAELMVEIARGEWLPTLFADVNYIRQKAAFPTDQWWSGVLSLSLPIFDGGLALSHKREAEQDQIQAELKRDQLVRYVRSEVIQTRLTTLDLQKVYRVIEEQVALATLTFEDIDKIYAVGEATDLDVLEARRTLIESERMLNDVENDMILAACALELSLGTLGRGITTTAEGEPEYALEQ
jgi:outer membrane protein